MGSCLCLLSEVSHDHAIHTTSTLTEEKKRLRLRAVPPFRQSPLRESKEKNRSNKN